MAAPKRPHGSGGIAPSDATSKKTKLYDDEAVDDFLKWCAQHSLSLSKKVRIGKEGSVAQNGMVATEDITLGECLFEIPRRLLLGPTTCSISSLLESEASSLESTSGWLPLLVGLMYEYTSPTSLWRPYFNLVPDFTELDLPMAWPREQVDALLEGTGVPEAVLKDVTSLEKEFIEKVKPFVKNHPEIFTDDRCQEVGFFKRMVAFVMAYSFTEPPLDSDDDEDDSNKPLPMMVPMADVLNHIAKNNAHLQFYKDSLKMEATRPIKKGQEVYNTYGELPNWQLLQMYGFAEKYPENHYDTVDITMSSVIKSVIASKPESEKDFTMKKWNFLKGLDVIQENGMYVLGIEGILTEEEMFTTLKVLCMDKGAFAEYEEKEGWSDVEDEDEDSDSLTFDDIPQLPSAWKAILKRVAQDRLQLYGNSIKQTEDTLTTTALETLNRRERYSTFVRNGQQKLLTKLIDVCSENQ